MSNFTLRGQLRCHQVLVHLQAHHEIFAVRVVRVQWRTRVLLKFKLSCTVQWCYVFIQRYKMLGKLINI